MKKKLKKVDEMSGTGGGASVTPGVGDGVATKYAFGKKNKKRKPRKKVPPRSMRLASLVNEVVTYNKFKARARTRPENSQFHQAVREVKTRLAEVNKILEYTNKMRGELSEDAALKYSRFTEKALNQMSEMVVNLYKNLKELKK